MNGLMMMTALAGCLDTVDPAATDDHEPSADPSGNTEPEYGTLRIRDAYGEVHAVTVKNVNGRAIYEGDMNLGDFARTKERAFASPVTVGNRWFGNVVRYQFQTTPAGCTSPLCSCEVMSGHLCHNLNWTEQWFIRTLMDKYTEETGIVFEESSTQPFISLAGTDDPLASYTYADGDFHNLGFSPLITFSTSFASDDRVVLHELGHALGLTHEQKRNDADSTIKFNAICMEDPNQFDSAGSSFNYLSPFDDKSIMLYSSWTFARASTGCNTVTSNCCPAILSKTGSPQKTFSYTNDTGKTIKVTFEGTQYIMNAGATTTFTGAIIDRFTDFSDEDLNAFYQMYPPNLGMNESGDRFGGHAAVGDFNGDGYKDLAVSAVTEGPNGHATSGAVY
ncbi:MAG TPA: M12 family metallopeptidase, partial [Kofleriaceae bacterium]|nr:M12 family metallopeptidase [Kofleriaceae bacterium]